MDINLLPWRNEIIEYNKKILLRLIFAALALSGVFLIFIYNLLFQSVSYSENYVIFLEKAKTNLLGNISSYVTYKKTQKEVNERFSVFQKLKASRYDSVRLLNQISKAIPKGIYLTYLSRDNDRIEMTGSAASNLLVSQMMQSIDASKYVKIHTLQNVEKSEGQELGYTRFNLRLELVFPSEEMTVKK